MRKLALSALLGLLSLSTFALDAKQASQITKKYSELVACQISDASDQKSQYKAVKLSGDGKEIGTTYAVFWQGDVGCSGGNATVNPNFTVVEQRGFESVDPVVATDYTWPELDLVIVTEFTGANGILKITGITYGAKDRQGWPKKPVSYTLKLDGNKFVKQ